MITDPKQLYDAAHAAGHAAATQTIPTPMTVVEHANPLNDTSPVTNQWYVREGVCGFAWVNIRPARGPFVAFCKKQQIGKIDSYAGGWTIWVHDYGQSYDRKCAYADAFARVLRENGLKAWPHDRLD